MTKKRFVLAVDQGTSSSRSIVFDQNGRVITSHQVNVPTTYVRDGWAEQNPEDIWNTTIHTMSQALRTVSKLGGVVAAIGIANQRETTLVWDRDTGSPAYKAILWHDRRTNDMCQRLIAEGQEHFIQKKTGLLLDPYFSATKLCWMLDNLSDATNASRTSLFNILKCHWDDHLLEIFRIPPGCLPNVFDSIHHFGETDPNLFGQKIPILAMIGDQQASAIGHGCIESGSAKSTYGTGCFLMMNTGTTALSSANRLLTTIAYQIGGTTSYATEGSVFVAGEAVKWLRDGLGIISTAHEIERLAESEPNNNDLYLVPAFNGLGAPHWDPKARAALHGITASTNRSDIARAVLDAACYQTADIISAARQDGIQIHRLRVDGGMSANNWFLQRLADILDIQVERPKVTETTALGAAYLAGLNATIFNNLEDINSVTSTDSRFSPSISDGHRSKLMDGWRTAIERTLTSF